MILCTILIEKEHAHVSFPYMSVQELKLDQWSKLWLSSFCFKLFFFSSSIFLFHHHRKIYGPVNLWSRDTSYDLFEHLILIEIRSMEFFVFSLLQIFLFFRYRLKVKDEKQIDFLFFFMRAKRMVAEKRIIKRNSDFVPPYWMKFTFPGLFSFSLSFFLSSPFLSFF